MKNTLENQWFPHPVRFDPITICETAQTQSYELNCLS